jgi:hypothetical protein
MKTESKLFTFLHKAKLSVSASLQRALRTDRREINTKFVGASFMGNIHFRERRLFSLFSSTFVALLTVVLLFRQCFIINGELFTALSHWETLIRLENNFVNHLEEFVATNGDEFPRMTDLKRFLRKVKPRAFAAARDNDRFVSHPVNGFLIIKRFTSDWFEIEEIVKNSGVESGRCTG